MDEETRRKIFLQASGCLENVVGGGGHLTSFSMSAESFVITSARELGGGLTEFGFSALATTQNEFMEYPTDSQPDEQPPAEVAPEDAGVMAAAGGQVGVSATIVLDGACNLALDDEGNVRLTGYSCLPPALWHPDHMRR